MAALAVSLALMPPAGAAASEERAITEAGSASLMLTQASPVQPSVPAVTLTRERGTPQAGGQSGITVPAAAPIESQQSEEPTIVNAGLPVARREDLRCDLRFDELPEARTESGRLNRPFNPHEFREVAWLSTRSIKDPRADADNCSGTLIADRWILTAAHCFFWEGPAGPQRQHFAASEAPDRADVRRNRDRVVWQNDVRSRIQVQFWPERPGGALDPVLSSRVIVHGQYGGRRGGFNNDLALVELMEPVQQALRIQPARLPSRTETTELITISGYGFSNAPGHRLGILEVGWPPRLNRRFDSADLTYDFAAGGQAPSASGFCPGDSGGPAFLGRHRGCTTAEEARPRPVAGVISTLTQPGARLNETEADRCLRSPRQRLVSVMTPSSRDWICRHTADLSGRPTVLGCSRR